MIFLKTHGIITLSNFKDIHGWRSKVEGEFKSKPNEMYWYKNSEKT